MITGEEIREQLYESPVQFVEDRANDVHEYWLGFDTLQGVTTILKNVIFYDKYSDIDPAVLRHAADRGTAIHEAVQAYLDGLPQPTCAPEFEGVVAAAVESFKMFQQTTKVGSWQHVASEHMVSNEEDVASKVDLIEAERTFDEAFDLILVDIKTTSELDEEYLSWQLSTYKVLFEARNGFGPWKAVRLYAYWYDIPHNSWSYRPIQFKGVDAVRDLIQAYRDGEIWDWTKASGYVGKYL